MNVPINILFNYFLKGLFNGFSIESIQETTLGGNEWEKDSKRLVWKSHNDYYYDNESLNHKSLKTIEANLSVTLNPKQIRTFVITLTTEN